MSKEQIYKDAIIIDGDWYVLNDVAEGSDCESCALESRCTNYGGTLCDLLHNAGRGVNYIKL